jgi:hypothetical protein
MSYAITSPHVAGRRNHFGSRLAAFASTFSWAMEMGRRCEREMAAGRRLDDDAIRRIASEVDAWQWRRT